MSYGKVVKDDYGSVRELVEKYESICSDAKRASKIEGLDQSSWETKIAVAKVEMLCGMRDCLGPTEETKELAEAVEKLRSDIKYLRKELRSEVKDLRETVKAVSEDVESLVNRRIADDIKSLEEKSSSWFRRKLRVVRMELLT